MAKSHAMIGFSTPAGTLPRQFSRMSGIFIEKYFVVILCFPSSPGSEIGHGHTHRRLEVKRLTNPDQAIVVLPELNRNFMEKGVISTEALEETINLKF
jgi:hypothetical protein